MFHLNNSQSLTVSEFVMGINVGTSLSGRGENTQGHPEGGGGVTGAICTRAGVGGGGPKGNYKRKICCQTY